MPDLSRDRRRALASTIETAREAAEVGVREALRRLGVFDARRPERLDDVRNKTRKRFRAHAKSLGDRLDGADGEPLRRLTEAAAYVQWHRLLFARFLLERGLLRDEAGVTLSLSDCREEAAMEGGGDEWSVASTHAARTLLGVFPTDDPVEALVLAPEYAKALRDHLLKLDEAIFQADDSLGWTYQFWRTSEKKAINESQVKIGATELPAVTQLFTEPYMVRFLLHNTLGAWWAAKVLAGDPVLARNAANEDALRAACALPGYAWDYLRFVKDGETWRPAAGDFLGWPRCAAELTVLDPCCGSGHFLSEALSALTALRAREDGLAAANAVDAVLRDNVAGLEIDGRCVQIASFALALTAWRIGGPQSLPNPNVAWVGAPPPFPKEQFVALANGDPELQRGLGALHDLFMQAPLLGSLIEPEGGDLVDPMRVARIEDSIATLVERVRGAEPERAEGAIAARGMADAAEILARKWVLQATNVPFLGRAQQAQPLADYLNQSFADEKGDLATAMLARTRCLATFGGTIGIVTPQNWLFLGGYKRLRQKLLRQCSINAVVTLGEEAWEAFGQRGPLATLLILSSQPPNRDTSHAVIDTTKIPTRERKILECKLGQVSVLLQDDQINNPDSRIVTERLTRGRLLSEVASYGKGSTTGDTDNYHRAFWELSDVVSKVRWLDSPIPGELWSGRNLVLRVPIDDPTLILELGCRIHGQEVWNRSGVCLKKFRELTPFIYDGEIFDDNINPVVPHDPLLLSAVWSYVSSPDYSDEVRKIDKKRNVTSTTLTKVPFDLAHWQQIAAEKYPDGLPEPYSDDATQWLFHGHPRHATAGTELHVALARLSGYRWPAETDPNLRLSTEARARVSEAATLPPSDADGLLALVPVLGERPLADRLRAYCVTAWGGTWTPKTEAALVVAACERYKDKAPRQLTLDAWLRTHAARQHSRLFHDRSFLWWITDGRADGFTAVAHYHRLTTGNLERLAYTVLGDWISRLGDDPRAEAALVLQAKLARILEGENPYDIFVRWKPLHAQPFGWDPDLDDGVRMNIRPFIEGGVLAHVPNGIHYRADRGKDVPSAPWFHRFKGERRNDHHTTLEEKQLARAEQAAKQPARA